VRSVVFQSGKSSIFALLLVVLVSFFAMALVPATSEGGSVAMRASDFLNTLGADTHLIQGLETPAAVIAGLRYLENLKTMRHTQSDGCDGGRAADRRF
jgi:hypothetical protein